MPPEEAKRIARKFKTIRKSQKAFAALENTNLHKDGRLVVLETSGVPIFDANGRLQGFRGIDRDISERKRAEEELRESEESYRELADSITDIFFAMDKDFRYTYWNKASEELTGIKAEDALGKSIFEIFPDREDTKRAVAVYREVLKTQQPQTFVNEYTLHNRNYFFEISVYPAKSGLAVFTKNITERKRMEEELREKERLATIGEVAAGLAHEIKNPLFAISSGIQVLQYGSKLDEAQKETLDIIFKETMRVDRLIRQLLGFTIRQELKLTTFQITTQRLSTKSFP